MCCATDKKNIFHRCEVIAHRDLAADIFTMSLKMPLAQLPLAGMFLHIRVHAGTDPLLRRPFSVYDYDERESRVDILYKVVGKGTLLLSKIKPGETLDVLGPLGNSFQEAGTAPNLLLVGGGVGIPPLHLLAKRRCMEGTEGLSITFLCGLVNITERVLAQRLEKLPITLLYSTDNGTLGHHGMVTDLLERQLAEYNADSKPLVCACGPVGMLKVVQRICRQQQVRCFLSLESIMPCGLGACLGCVVGKAVGEGYYRVCREGPVFPAEEVKL